MKVKGISIRAMTEGDLSDFMHLVEEVGWNQTEQDLKIFLKGPTNINLAAIAEGKIIGTVSAINYHQKIAWISMMIVSDVYRRKGIGKYLMQTIIQGLRDKSCQTIKLDATPAGKVVYEKLGFKEAFRINRLLLPSPKRPGKDYSSSFTLPINSTDVDQVIKLDQAVFGANRGSLMKALVKTYPGKVIKLDAGGQIKAFTLGRRGRLYYQIGPLVASDLSACKSLIISALETPFNQPVIVDVLANKENFTNWLLDLGFQFQRPLYRMFLEVNHSPGQPNLQYLICGPEFG